MSLPSYPNSAWQIKTLGIVDLVEILKIEQRSHPHPWSQQNFESSLKSHSAWGLLVEDRLSAYAIVSFVAGESELLLFVVDKSLQGQGWGARFLDAVIEQVKKRAQALFLEVRASNIPAIALYESLGFSQVGERPNYYPSAKGREDALIYALEFLD